MASVSLLSSPGILLISGLWGQSLPCALLPPHGVPRLWLPRVGGELRWGLIGARSPGGTAVRLSLALLDLGPRRRRLGPQPALQKADEVGWQPQDCFPGGEDRGFGVSPLASCLKLREQSGSEPQPPHLWNGQTGGRTILRAGLSASWGLWWGLGASPSGASVLGCLVNPACLCRRVLRVF